MVWLGGILASIFAGLASLAFFHVEEILPLPLSSSALTRAERLGSHYFLNDAVGIDANESDLPAAFLVSHSSRAAVVRTGNSGDVSLTWADDFGLTQDANIRGWGGVATVADRLGALQIDYQQTMLVGRVDVSPDKRAEILVSLPWPARIACKGRVKVSRYQSSADRTDVSFALEGSGSWQIEPWPPPSDGFAVSFTVRNIAAQDIVLGPERVSPRGTAFTLSTRDFHSVAVGELDGDSGAEVSVVRGGMRGRIGIIDAAATDVLYDFSSGREVTPLYPGMRKDGCPGRQSAWVDIDGDDRLELFIICGRSGAESGNSDNKLLRWHNGRFVDEAAAVGLNFNGLGSFRFVDWNGDLQPDLLWVDTNGDITLYQNHAGAFRQSQRIASHPYSLNRVPQLLVRDVDEDSSPDLLIVQAARNRLILNRDGKMLEVEPRTHGLPDRAVAAVFADWNLDGHADLLSDRGYFAGVGQGQFRRQEGTADVVAAFTREARMVSYVDHDERKILLALYRCLPFGFCAWRRELLQLARRWDAAAFAIQESSLLEPDNWAILTLGRHHAAAKGREVGLILAGEATNPNSIGAHVEFLSVNGRQVHWVGENETSHFSQGNFAIYVTAELNEPLSGKAVWQDGCESSFSVPPSIRRFTVSRAADCTSSRSPSQP